MLQDVLDLRLVRQKHTPSHVYVLHMQLQIYSLVLQLFPATDCGLQKYGQLRWSSFPGITLCLE